MNIVCNEMRNFRDPANDHFCGFPADFQNNFYLVLKTRWEYSKYFLYMILAVVSLLRGYQREFYADSHTEDY